MAGAGDTRDYRGRIRAQDLISYQVKVRESDLLILTPSPRAKEALSILLEVRLVLEAYIDLHPAFVTSLVPLEVEDCDPEVVKTMARAAQAAGVGPMAAVAGAIAQAVGERLVLLERDVVVENGGDIYIHSRRERVTALFAGDSPLSMKVGIRVPEGAARGVCTSSGRVGHSFSRGKAHSVTVVARDAAMADAAATALANMVQSPRDIGETLKKARELPDLLGVVVICEDCLGAWGEASLVPLGSS